MKDGYPRIYQERLSSTDLSSYSSRQSEIDGYERARREQFEDEEIICQIIQAILCQQNTLSGPTFSILTDHLTGTRFKAWSIKKTRRVFGFVCEEWWLLSNGKIQHYQNHIMIESFIAENNRLALYLCGKSAFIDLAKSLKIKLQDNWQ